MEKRKCKHIGCTAHCGVAPNAQWCCTCCEERKWTVFSLSPQIISTQSQTWSQTPLFPFSLALQMISSFTFSSSGFGQQQRHFESSPITGMLGFIVAVMFSFWSSRALFSPRCSLSEVLGVSRGEKMRRNWWLATVFRPPANIYPCYCLP